MMNLIYIILIVGTALVFIYTVILSYLYLKPFSHPSKDELVKCVSLVKYEPTLNFIRTLMIPTYPYLELFKYHLRIANEKLSIQTLRYPNVNIKSIYCIFRNSSFFKIKRDSALYCLLEPQRGATISNYFNCDVDFITHIEGSNYPITIYNPEANIFLNLAEIAFELKLYSVALENIDKAIKFDPFNSHYEINRAMYLFYLERYELSRKSLERAIALKREYSKSQTKALQLKVK